MFECPVHGLESEVFCFRAFDKDNIHLWRKFQFRQCPIKQSEQKLVYEEFIKQNGKKD